MNNNQRCCGLLLLAAFSGSSQAFDMALGVKGGTLGLGAEATFKLHEKVNVRAVLNTFTETDTFTEDGINYTGEMKLGTYGLTADWHPFNGAFRLSAGIMSNGNEFNLVADCKQVCDIDGSQYTSDPANPGQVMAVIDFKSMSPYAGIGWGNAMSGGKWYVGADLGVLFQGTPQAALTASGVFRNQLNIPVSSSSPVFQAQLQNEETLLQDEMSSYDMYPVLNLSVGYRF